MTVIDFPTKASPPADTEPAAEEETPLCYTPPNTDAADPTFSLRQISTETYEIIDEEVMIDEMLSHISRVMDQIGCTDRMYFALEDRMRLIKAIRVMEGKE